MTQYILCAIITTKNLSVLVYEVMQDFYHQQYSCLVLTNTEIVLNVLARPDQGDKTQ